MLLSRFLPAVLAFSLSAPLLYAAPPPAPDAARVKPLFDGRTMEGWEGNAKLWRVQDGTLAGGSLTENVDHNDFVATKADYGNFVLRLKIKLSGTEGFINSGVQIRSTRVPNNSEMCGYQCDYGDPTWWGSIYDESRRNKVMAQSDMKALDPVIKRNDWNDYVIRADGARITTWINGVEGVDYIEADPKIPQSGKIGIQVHGGGKALVQVKDVTIEELPASPKREGAAEPKPAAKPSPVSPDEQKASFTVPPGFEIELVASEDESKGTGKFIAVYFDEKGRMWTMTALEYPVDANENPAAADALYASKAKDKILVYDIEDRGTNGAPPRFAKEPRVFADGLAIPLGILPYKDGCYVQHGHDIALLRDTNNDGKADQRDLVLSGFGVQDSHLFPHQFTRAPGGWIWLAQGAFNYGKVRGTDGKEVQFDQTRMARFKPDGSEFEITSNGPCNIWGLAMNGEGETFIQEANDYGYPVMPFHEYGNYPGCSNGQWKSYAPEFPATAEFRVGGTGLSGLALTDPSGAYPPEWSDVMLVANPIIRKIQAIKMRRSGGGWKLEWLPDFVSSGDEWFRPVAMTLGPDGCVYIVDWYNKIISHNEVPRNHPERDKKRGRIWRVKHKDQQCFPVPDFTALSGKELAAKLGGASVAQAHLAWQTILDRDLKELSAELTALPAEGAADAATIQKLWAADGLGGEGITPKLVEILAADSNRNVRREAARLIGSRMVSGAGNEKNLPAAPALALLQKLTTDPDEEVRAEVIRSAGRLLGHTGLTWQEKSAAVAVLMQSARPALDVPASPSTHTGKPVKTGEGYIRDFERYLVRLFLEQNPAVTAAYLDSAEANSQAAEARMVAALALPPKDSAPRVAKLIASLDRAPSDEEILRLAEASGAPEVRTALASLIGKPEALQALLRQRTRFDARVLAPLLKEEAGKLLTSRPELGLEIVSAFKLDGLEPQVAAIVEKAPAAALRTLRLLGSTRAEAFLPYVKSADGTVRGEALACLAAVPDKLIPLWPDLDQTQRHSALDLLAGSKNGAGAVVAAVLGKTISGDDLEGPVVEKLAAVLGENDAGLKSLMEQMGSAFRPVLLLDGRNDSWVRDPIELKGAFTVECWVRLAPGIGNEDSILGAPNEADFNFFGGKFRVWTGPPAHDAIVAKKPVAEDLWTHVAVTRDETGHFKIYLNGELDQAEGAAEPRTFRNLRIGHSNVPQGTTAALSEFRVWNVCRTPEEIRAHFDRTFPAPPTGLVLQRSGTGWGALNGSARVAKTTDFPAVLTPEQAKAADAKYEHYFALAEKPGDPAQGKLLAAVCMGCHQINGTGAVLGPNLSGAGAMGVEGVLRNLLNPNAAMEPGYRVYRIEMTDGGLKEGFLVSEDDKAIVFRQPGLPDQRVARDQIRRGKFLKRSLMPEGLLDAFTDQQITDLFSFLKTLK